MEDAAGPTLGHAAGRFNAAAGSQRAV